MEKIAIKGDSELEITRRENGLFSVRASSKRDAYRGLGACHAHDRGMQMLLLRTLALGRGSELLQASDEMLAIDEFSRRAGFALGVEDESKKVDDDERMIVEAYCDGVNQVLSRRLPWEMRLLRVPFTPWGETDIIALSRFIAYVGLAQGQGEIERLIVQMIQAGVTREQLDELFPGQVSALTDELLELIKKARFNAKIVPDAVRFSPMIPKAMASNNWVISPRKTKKRGAMLCNDPHLEINGLPAVWYEVSLAWADTFVMGAGMAGLPAIIIGRTPKVSWGVTYSFLDGVDSWIEEVKGGRYRRAVGGKDAWIEIPVRREVIKRKGKADVVLDVHETRRGDLGFHGAFDVAPTSDGYYLATRWATADGTGAASLKALLGVVDATSAEAALQALGGMESAWNWVAADRDGHIGYQMSGLMPDRREGASGLLPLPGWDPANDWRGFVAFSSLPRAFDPLEGFFVTANQDLSRYGERRPQNSPMGAWRADRIAEELSARDDWDVDGVRKLQLDLYSLQAEKYLAAAQRALEGEPRAAPLYAWDKRCVGSSREAMLFERFYREIFLETFGPTLGRAALEHLMLNTAMFADFYEAFDNVMLRREESSWFAGRSRDEIYRRAFRRAAAMPEAPLREKQTITMKHMLFAGKLPRWLGFDAAGVVIEGSRATVHQGQVFRAGNRETSFTSSFRFVTEMGATAMHTVLPGGPSDRRFSRWYKADLGNWIQGRLKTTRYQSDSEGDCE